MAERDPQRLFQQLWELLPDDDPARLEHTSTVRDALATMERLGVSTLPVVTGSEVVGVFSFRDFALGLGKVAYRKSNDVLDLLVEDFVVTPTYASATDPLTELVQRFSSGEVLLVGRPENLQGMVTPADALRYFFNVASPYVLLKQIELAIRELLRRAVSGDQLAAFAKECLASTYNDEAKIPKMVDAMSFADYTTILRTKKTWSHFVRAFGHNQENCSARLKPLPDLRNDVFHFRRELSVEDYQKLRDARDWLMTRLRLIEAETRDE